MLHSLLRDRDLGKVTIPSGMPLGEFAEKWLADVRGRVRPRTAAWYEDVLRRWILPCWAPGVCGTSRFSCLARVSVPWLRRAPAVLAGAG